MSDPHILLTGDHLALALPRADMLPTYHRWENDPGTILGYGTQWPQTLETRAGGWEHQASNDRRIAFEVLTAPDAEPVGTTVLLIDPAVRTAEFIIVLAPEARGKGLATEATALTLDWAFHLGALRMVWLKVLAPNTTGQRAYTKAGFHTAGTLRQSGYWLGQPTDEILMDALAQDWTGPSWATRLLTRDA